jgi:predicted PurR-regulated permease PerM
MRQERRQSSLCLILAEYYDVALRLIGLEHGILIGIAAGLISFIPYLGSLAGLIVSTCIARICPQGCGPTQAPTLRQVSCSQ